MTGRTIAFVLMIILVGCAPQPRDINYGEDVCSYCRMTIVDKQHAAQAVTDKGKIHVFDAIECMVHFVREDESAAFAHLLVNHYTEPEILHEAAGSTYIISQELPSPMGAFLNALPNQSDAQALIGEVGGEVYAWDELVRDLD